VLVSKLIKQLQKLPVGSKISMSSDEELNNVFKNFSIDQLEDNLKEYIIVPDESSSQEWD